MVSTAMALATLPPLAPPIPSQTMTQALFGENRPQSQLSWLELRTAPTSVSTGADALPAGNYRIVESGAPEGYDASDASVTFTVKADEVRDLTGDPVTDEVFRGGVQVTKSDKELQASEALAGSGHKEAPGEHPRPRRDRVHRHEPLGAQGPR